MAGRQLVKNTKITRVIDATAGATTDVEGSIIDMQGFEGVQFAVLFGTLTATAVTSIKVQQGAQSNLSDAADLEGSSISLTPSTHDDMVAVTDIFRPTERYVRVVVDRGTANAVIDGALALQYGARVAPTTHDATTVVTPEAHVSPDEGTA